MPASDRFMLGKILLLDAYVLVLVVSEYLSIEFTDVNIFWLAGALLLGLYVSTELEASLLMY